jgi:HEPN domain-containing protein
VECDEVCKGFEQEWGMGMGSHDHVDILVRRSKSFYSYALEALSRGDFDLALFLLEQATQLRVKALLLRLLGFIPKEHRIRELLGILAKYLESLNREELARLVQQFVDVWRSELRVVEEAYTGSRYLLRIYDKSDVEKALKVVEELFKVVEAVESSVFS